MQGCTGVQGCTAARRERRRRGDHPGVARRRSERVGALRRPQLVYAGVRGGRNKVAAQYCTHALTTHAAPRQVHSHLCGKLALTAPAAIKDIRESINSLDVSGPETDRSRATISSLRVAFLAQPDDDDEEDEDAAEGETPIADDGCTEVWRDKRL